MNFLCACLRPSTSATRQYHTQGNGAAEAAAEERGGAATPEGDHHAGVVGTKAARPGHQDLRTVQTASPKQRVSAETEYDTDTRSNGVLTVGSTALKTGSEGSGSTGCSPVVPPHAALAPERQCSASFCVDLKDVGDSCASIDLVAASTSAAVSLASFVHTTSDDLGAWASSPPASRLGLRSGTPSTSGLGNGLGNGSSTTSILSPGRVGISQFNPLQLRAQVGDLTYLGHGAAGVVYKGTISGSRTSAGVMTQTSGGSRTGSIAAPGWASASSSKGALASSSALGMDALGARTLTAAVAIPVAVKFMLCASPQQLWQRAKEALLSKLVVHPNLVRTMAMDAHHVTEATFSACMEDRYAATAAHGPGTTGGALHSAAVLSGPLHDDPAPYGPPRPNPPEPGMYDNLATASMQPGLTLEPTLNPGHSDGMEPQRGMPQPTMVMRQQQDGAGLAPPTAGSGALDAAPPLDPAGSLQLGLSLTDWQPGQDAPSSNRAAKGTAVVHESVAPPPAGSPDAGPGHITDLSFSVLPHMAVAAAAAAAAAYEATQPGGQLQGGAALAGVGPGRPWQGPQTAAGAGAARIDPPRRPSTRQAASVPALPYCPPAAPFSPFREAAEAAEAAAAARTSGATRSSQAAAMAIPLAPHQQQQGGGTSTSAHGLVDPATTGGLSDRDPSTFTRVSIEDTVSASASLPLPLLLPEAADANPMGYQARAAALLPPVGMAVAALQQQGRQGVLRPPSAPLDAPVPPPSAHVLPVFRGGGPMQRPVASSRAASMPIVPGMSSQDPTFYPSPLGPRHGCATLQKILYQLGATPGSFVTQAIMEFCDGGTLLQRIGSGEFNTDPARGVLLAATAMHRLVCCAQEIVAGMAHLHSLNLIHGDLKPGNVLLTSCPESPLGYECKVSDFGLATALEASEQNITSDAWGTMGYMAPEVLAGRIRKASDVYSFGVLLWQMCSGQRPYAGMTAGQVLLGVKSGQLRLQWPPWTNKSLVKVGEACMRHDPKERPGFKGVANALAKVAVKLEQKIVLMHAISQHSTLVPSMMPPAAPGQRSLQSGLGAIAAATELGTGGLSLAEEEVEVETSPLTPALVSVDANGPAQMA